MPSIYKAACSKCGEPPPHYHLGKMSGAHFLIASEGTAFDDPEQGIIMIPHPGEAGSLRVLGAKPFNGDGRVLAWQAVVCTDCGAVTEKFHVMQRDSGCLVGFAIALVAGLSLMPFLGVIGGCVVIYVCQFLWMNCYERLERRKWRERNSELELLKCPGCDSMALVALSRSGSRPFHCRYCQEQTMIFEPWGIS